MIALLAMNDCNEKKMMWVPILLQLKYKEMHFQLTITEKEIT